MDIDNAMSPNSGSVLYAESLASPIQETAHTQSTDAPSTLFQILREASQCPLRDFTVSQLLLLGQEANFLDLSGCFERSNMVVDILLAGGVTGRACVDLEPRDFAGWSISQLCAVASKVHVDCSRCSDQHEIILRILHEANFARPHLRNYLLQALSPLMTSTNAQLLATARSWQVDISGCLEKEEIIQRLLTHAHQFGRC